MREKVNSTNALVAYLDILGYSQLIKSGEYANIVYSAIDSSISRWTSYANRKKYNIGASVREHLGLQIISDSFIVTLDFQKIISESGEDSKVLKNIVLMVFLDLISYLIQDCMREIKLPIRGAIVCGKYYSQEFQSLEKNSFIFSEALVEAYTLAEEMADVPRVLIDKSVLNCMVPTRISGIRPDREILCDVDGLHYLNIYASIFTDAALIPILQGISAVINSNSEKDKNNPKILRKYHWFANFHNKIVNEIITVYRKQADLQSHVQILEAAIIDIPSIYQTGFPDWAIANRKTVPKIKKNKGSDPTGDRLEK